MICPTCASTGSFAPLALESRCGDKTRGIRVKFKTLYLSVLLIPQIAAAALRGYLFFFMCFGLPLFSLGAWSYSVYRQWYCFLSLFCNVLPHLIRGGMTLFSLLFSFAFRYVFLFLLCYLLYRMCMPRLPYPVRRHYIALSTLLTWYYFGGP